VVNSIVYKVYSPSCYICSMMGVYDSQVFSELGLEMVEVHEDKLEEVTPLWQYLIRSYPRDEIHFPSYISLDTREVIIGGCSKKELKSLAEEFFLPKCKLDQQVLPFREERVLMSLLPRLSDNGWGLVTLNPPLFYTGEPLNPPSILELPDGSTIEITTPGDIYAKVHYTRFPQISE